MTVAAASWPALGTTATVLVVRPEDLPAARSAVVAELAAIDRSCSRFRDDSDLERLNAASGRPVRASALLLEAVAVALRAAAVTDGAVDPTVGEALILAGYDRDFAAITPGPVRVRAARVAGWRTVAVDTATGTVALPRGVRLDLGATAKALAADRAAAAAAAAVPAAGGVLVSLGGDIATAGVPPRGGWPVRVTEDHAAPADAPAQTVTIASGGLATSSTTVRRWGTDAHHIIDPRTGLPARGRWRTVTVAAATCVDANIASTAAIIFGDEAAAWLTQLGLPARLVDCDGDVHVLGRWPQEALAA